MSPAFTTLDALQNQVATDLGLGTADPLHPAYCSGPGGRQEQRRIVDLVCEHGVAYLDCKRPDRTQRQEDRFQRKVRKRAERIVRARDEEKTGFAPLIFIGWTIAGWLIQKAMEWLLRWWRTSTTAEQSLTAIRAGMPGAGWQDDPGDTDEDE